MILGIETSTSQVSCSLGGSDGVIAGARVLRGQRHAEMLTPMVAQVLAAAGVRPADLAAIAVGVGPGLYTGLRVGLATARAMAMALRVPMVGVPSLDLLAFPLRFSRRTIVTVIDARRNEVFWAFYRATPGGVQRLGDHRVDAPADVVAELLARGNDDVVLVGDGARRYRDVFAGLVHAEMADTGLAHPSADALVELSRPIFEREAFVSPAEIRPMYLRKPDAEANWVERPTTGRA